MEEKEFAARRFMFVYLNTGNGHIAQARVLKEAFADYAPGVEVVLQNGFPDKRSIVDKIFEKGYSIACNYIHGLWPFIYDVGELRLVQKVSDFFITIGTKSRFKKIILEKKITDVVCFHAFLAPAIHRALRELREEGIKVNYTMSTTDPFTSSSSCFFDKKIDYIVSSERFKKFGMKCGVPEKQLHIMPFLLNKKFRVPATKDEIRALRLKYGFDPDKRLVLLAGGGEGLPGTLKIINQCIIHRANFAVAVVCGRNKPLKESLDVMAKAEALLDLHVFGFVDFMDSLVKMCDVIVSKAGASTIMEIAASGKPAIISKYLYGQERGNMEYIVHNGAGFYLRHSLHIYRLICHMLKDDATYQSYVDKMAGLHIDTDVSKNVKFLMEK